MNKKGLLFLVACCSTLFAAAQTAVSTYQPGVTTEGAVYYLPKTALRISVLVEKSTYTPGDFAKYASRYLRLNDVKQEGETAYRIVGISQQAFGVADTSKVYAVRFNAKTVAANVALADDGRLLAINAEGKRQPDLKEFKAAPKGRQVNPRQFLTEEILAAGSTAKMAELTAREIYDLRENRSLLIKGQADFMPSDGRQMQLMLGQLDAQDQALTQLFQGTTERDTVEQVFYFCPDGPVSKQLIFRFSKKFGVVEADNLVGSPYYINIEDEHTVPVLAADAKNKKKNENGIYVNVPGRMRSTILGGVDVADVSEFPAAQFGNVELLSGELFNKRYTTRLWLNPTTGALERLEADEPK